MAAGEAIAVGTNEAARRMLPVVERVQVLVLLLLLLGLRHYLQALSLVQAVPTTLLFPHQPPRAVAHHQAGGRHCAPTL